MSAERVAASDPGSDAAAKTDAAAEPDPAADEDPDSDGSPVDLAGLPVAVLGWAGSTERQLRPVTRLWRARGADPFTARAQVFRAMARPDGWALEGASLAARIRARLRRGADGFGVHLFSNAGFWTWAAAKRALGADADRVRWVIVDSAPGFPREIDARFYADHASRAMMPMVLRAFGRPPALTHRWLTPPVWAFMRGWYHVSLPQQREAGASLDVVREGAAPMFFLYSAADELVPAHFVEAFVATLGARRATTERFEDSPHVAHLIRHRRRYHAAIDAFLATGADPLR